MDEKEKYLLLKSKAGFSMSFEDWSTEYNSDDKFKTSMDGALDRLSLKKKDFFGTEETPRESRKVEEPESSDSKLGEPSSVSQEEITDGSLESSTEEPITSEKPPEEPYDFEKTFLSGYKNPFPIPEDQDVVDYTQYDENKFQKQTVKLESLNQEIDNYRKPAVRYQDFSGKQREEYSVYVDKKKKSREIKSELAKSKFFRDQAIWQEVAY